MKIINIVLDGRIAGPQLRIAKVARRLKEEGVETIVIFPEKNSDKFRKLLNKYGIKYKTLKLNKLSKDPFGLIKWLVTFIPQTIKLVKIFKRINPDVIHCNASWQWKGIVAAKFAGKKIVWHLNDSNISFLILTGFKFLNKFAEGFIFAGKRTKEYYFNYIKEKKIGKIIHAPVDTTQYDPERKINPSFLRNEKGIKIITVANVNPTKGIEYFVEAASILTKKYDNLQFYVFGGLFKSQNKYLKYIKSLIVKHNLNNFLLYGFCENIASVLKDSDIYVCSSINEAAPMSVWEAMAMKKPIVSTDVGSVPDFIQNGENGFIVPVKSPEKLAEKIEVLIKDKKLREKFSKKVREVAVEKLDVKICAKRHKEFYEKIKEL